MPKSVANGPIDNNALLKKLIAWTHTHDKPLNKPMLTRFDDKTASQSFGELMQTPRLHIWDFGYTVPHN